MDGKWVALLRGVNVGGHNRVPMAALRDIAVALGWRDVATHIASGNLVFRAAREDHAARLRAAMEQSLGVDVPVLVVSASQVIHAVERCPWPEAEGKAVHLFWCWDDPVIDPDRVRAVQAPDEELRVEGRLIWLHAPSGIGRSKLAAGLDPGVEVTARNLNTLRKLAAMVQA